MYNLKELNSGQVVNIVFDTELMVSVENATVQGIVSYAIAKTYDDVLAKHKSIVSTIETPNVSSNASEYDYLLVKTKSGSIEVYASCWIKSITVVNKTTVNFTITLDNVDELTYVKKALASAGFSEVEYNIVNS